MAGFIYFISGATSASREALEAVGLWGALGNSQPHFGHLERGPSGGQGLLIAGGPNPPSIAYREAEQTWASCGQFWLGYEKSAPPIPSDLARPDPVQGHLVKLDDGNDWLIPVARLFLTGTAPDAKLRLGPDGAWVIGETVERLRELEVDAARIWDAVIGACQSAEPGSAVKVTLADEADTAARALGVNYRIGRFEAGALGVLTMRNVGKITWAIVDGPAIDETMRSKKVEAAGPPAAAGSPSTSGGGA